MTAVALALPPLASTDPVAPPAPRHDGWLPERRRRFLEAIAEGHTVNAACGQVGLSPAAAYALRRRDEGFALGWAAACLLAREALADLLMSRAIDGQVETWTRADGSEVTRHRHDNRLGQAMLARLDRLAEPRGEGLPEAIGAAPARAVAGGFDGFLDLIAAGADPAALDGYAREAAARTSQLSQLRPAAASDDDPETVDEPVWFDKADWQWRTALPPPKGFRGEEDGEYGDDGYSRTLTRAEVALADAREERRRATLRATDERRLAAWLGAGVGAPG